MKKVLVLICASLMLTACGPKGFSVKYKGKAVPFETKTAASSIRPDLGEGQIVLANYDIEIKDKSVMGIRDSEKPGEILIGFFFKNNDEKDFKDSVKPGDFTDKIKYMWVASGDKKDRVTFSEGGAAVKGKLTITEVTDDKIKGTIDVTKDDTSVSGPFEAKLYSKHL